MSVQAGIYNLDKKPVDKHFLEYASKELSEYAPDGESIYVDQSLGLLYRPLHTTTESQFQHQPYTTPKGGLMTWDGRLDNRDELIDLLSTGISSELTDVEIVADAFDRWGTEAFSKLVGDWSLVLWNAINRELFLARDFMGTKPLFYCVQPEQVLWCTHLLPLVQHCRKLTISDDYIAGFLASHPDAELTPYKEIRSVPPASFICLKGGRFTTHNYWRVDPNEIHYKTDAQYEEHYRHLLRQAVRRRLRSSVPILAELSGGLDSSSLVLMADELLASDNANVPRLETLSYHDSREPEDDDLAYIQLLEQVRGKKGVRLDLAGGGDSFSLDYTSFVACPGFGKRTELDSQLQLLIRSSGFRVSLSGLGGDEINAQTLNISVLVADHFMHYEIAKACKELVQWSLQSRRPWIQLFWRSIVQMMPRPLNIRFMSDYRKLTWIDSQFAREHEIAARQLHAVNEPWVCTPALRDWSRTITSLRNAVALGRPSPLEKRYPYLDRTLLEFMMNIPLNQLLRPGERRSLMRRALKDMLPQEILERKTKGTAVRCFCTTLLKHWNEVERALASPLSSRLHYLDKIELKKSLLAMRNGHVPGYSVALLRALSLELWLQDVKSRDICSCPIELSPIVPTHEEELCVHSR